MSIHIHGVMLKLKGFIWGSGRGSGDGGEEEVRVMGERGMGRQSGWGWV